MPRSKDKFIKCVYKISFINNPKIYIGSSARWPYRKREHIYKLTIQKHHNQYLQHAVNKYGLENLKIEQLEICYDNDSLKTREQYWIDFYDSINPQKGFNLVKMVEKIGTFGYKFTEEQKSNLSQIVSKRMDNILERRRLSKIIAEALKINPNTYGGKFIPKSFVFFSPKGDKQEIYNLCEFCRENNLDYPKMFKVHQGDLISHQGWKKDIDRKNLVKKNFVFINPEGEKINICGLRKFCLENNLCYKTMGNLHRGIGKTCQGWKKYIS